MTLPKRSLRATALAALAAALATAPSAAIDIAVHVSRNGNDTWSGMISAPDPASKDGPVASLARARDAARALRVRDASVSPHIVVHGGRHWMPAPLDLSAADSGLVVEAAAGEKPVLVGGRPITGWKPGPGGHLWSAPAPGTRDRKWDFRLLVVNGEVRPRARLPKSGTFEHMMEWKIPWMSTSGGGWQRKPTPGELTTMRYKAGDLGPWLNITNAEATVYHMWDESCVGIASHDPAAQTLVFSTPCCHPPGGFNVKKFVLWNLAEGMHEPGQWFLDRVNEKIVYWPLPGEDMAGADVLAPAMESILRIQGKAGAPAREITIKGLALTVTTTPLVAGGFGAGRFAGALALAHAADCRVEGVTIFNVAGQGIAGSNLERVTIENCETRHTGACGIRVGGAANTVRGNRTRHSGILYPSAIALSASGDANRIENNDIADAPYSGLTADGHNHLIAGNRIARVMTELHDGAGIYITFCSNIVVRGNCVSEIADTGGYGASAYYLDEQARACLVEDNFSRGVSWPIHMHMTSNNIARGNVFLVDGDAKISLAKTSGAVFERNILCATGDIVIRAATNGIAAMPGNIFFSANGKVLWERLDQYAAKGKFPLELRDGSLNADPRFKDPARGDLDFAPGSPAPRLGIRPLPAALTRPAQRPQPAGR